MPYRILAIALVILAATVGSASARTPDQVLHTKSSSGLALMNAYSQLVVDKDKPALAALLCQAFQIQRADGSHANRAQYLANLPDLRTYAYADVTQGRSSGIVTVRMQATLTLYVNGAMYNPAPAPQLVVFRWMNARWMLVAQGNFNLPTTA